MTNYLDTEVVRTVSGTGSKVGTRKSEIKIFSEIGNRKKTSEIGILNPLCLYSDE